VASSAFVVGAALLSRLFPYGRRGLALGVFTLGPVVAALVSALSRGTDQYGRGAAVVLGTSLIVVAALAAGVFRDPVGPHRRVSGLRRCVEMVVVASRTSLSLLYGLALGGLVAASIYLPVYLTAAFGLEWFHALTLTGTVIILSAIARLVGGWWTDRRPTARLLVACYMIAAGLCLVVAIEPRWWWLAASMIALAAVWDGLASGALLALIGKAARDDSAGALMGVTGAVAALGALLPPLLLAGVSRLGPSYSAAWVLLAAFLLGVALYVRAHGLRVGLGLAVQFQPGPSATRMTVAVVGEPDMDIGAAAVVARVAELASTDELVVVYGSDADDRARHERGGGGLARYERGGPYESTRARLSANALVAGLRDRLPRHSVVALRAAPRTAGLDQLATSLDELLDSGTVAVAVTSGTDIHEVAAHLASHLKADRILAVVYTPLRGAAAHEVWRREPMNR
jgi:NNP family nitrate/nitrite transporter-like MFS transporter